MSTPRSPDRRPTKAIPRAAALSETELQKQRADSEGMTPNKPQHENAVTDEGEGNRTADRRYRQGIARFLGEWRKQGAAKKAASSVGGLVEALARVRVKRARSK
jgi:hypothetical protein